MKNNLAKELAKAIVSTEKEFQNKQPSIDYGTVIVGEESLMVLMDGASSPTPAETVVEVSNSDRVKIEIKNHKLTITGNITNPAAQNISVIKRDDDDGKNLLEVGQAQRVTGNGMELHAATKSLDEDGNIIVVVDDANYSLVNSNGLSVYQNSNIILKATTKGFQHGDWIMAQSDDGFTLDFYCKGRDR